MLVFRDIYPATVVCSYPKRPSVGFERSSCRSQCYCPMHCPAPFRDNSPLGIHASRTRHQFDISHSLPRISIGGIQRHGLPRHDRLEISRLDPSGILNRRLVPGTAGSQFRGDAWRPWQFLASLVSLASLASVTSESFVRRVSWPDPACLLRQHAPSPGLIAAQHARLLLARCL